ncbi:MAG: thioesterase family protein [Mucinivorans sp.]
MISTNVQLRWSDMDMYGHMYNGHYQQIYDLGKSDYFSNVLALAFDRSDDVSVIMASIHIDFLEPVLLDEQIHVTTQIGHIGTKSFSVSQQIISTQSGAIKSKSETTIVAYNRVTNHSVEIPTAWREKMKKDSSY